MKFRYTKHAGEKFERLKKAGFTLKKEDIERVILKAEKNEDRTDGTTIATIGWDKTHVLRVVYRKEGLEYIIITFYPGRRKQYVIPLRS